MPRVATLSLHLACWLSICAADEAPPVGHLGEKLDPATYGPGIVEPMSVVLERDRLGRFADELGDIPAPQSPPPPELSDAGSGAGGEGTPRGGAGTAPELTFDFRGVLRGDAGSNSYPPDTCGAIGPNHFVEVVNRNFAVYDRFTGAELINVLLGSFLPGSNGDPRVLYDQYSGRWIVIVSNFSGGQQIFLAVSRTDDPTGAWFKTNFRTDQGSDAGCWPDYPTLGVNADGIYTATYMVGCNMTIFAIDKAPLLSPMPSLGTITAFRNLPFEGAIQPAHTYGTAPGEYFVSTQTSTSLRIRRLTGPLTSPTLVETGSVPVPAYSEPPDAPALGSTTPLDTVGSRLMNAVFRAGSLYTAHCVAVGSRAACRWYQITTSGNALVQSGTVADSVRYYFFPSITVNSRGDLAMGFSGSHAAEYAGAYYTGRLVDDPPGEMAPPALLKAGQGPHNLIDSFGRNRFGDYSLTTLDPNDEITMWTIQEYVHDTDIWGTWVGRLVPLRPALIITFPDGTPELVAPGVPTPFDVLITPGDENVVPGSPTLHYRYDGGAYLNVPLELLGGNLYRATLPAADCDDTPEFYVSARGDGGTTVTNPRNAPATVLTAVVGDVTVFFDDDLESDRGWVVGAPDDDATTGIWTRVDPIGTAAQPEDDHTPDPGVMCFVTGQGSPGGSIGENDVDNGQTTLTTPRIDLSGAADAAISYWRWYSNNQGGSPNADIFVIDITNDNGTSWTRVETIGPAGPGTSGGWIFHEFRVADFVAPTANVRVRFIASDLGSGSIVEAAVDDFRAFLFSCQSPACPGDLDGDGDVDLADVGILLSDFGCAGAACPGDVDGDGDTDLADLGIVLSGFGHPCP